jgi:hypothetical protein
LGQYNILKLKQHFRPIVLPTSSYTSVSGYSNGIYNSAQLNSYGTTTSVIPLKKDYYLQKAYFLKINKTIPIWNLRKKEVIDENSIIKKQISDLNYDITEYQIDNKIVGFIDKVKDLNSINEVDSIKYSYDVDNNLGVYVMLNNQPQPAQFSINNFGYFEVSFLIEDNIIDFSIKQ